MNTGSRDEQMMLANIARMTEAMRKAADALERIARALEERVYGTTSEEIGALKVEMLRDIDRDPAA